jgi:hypothetical protein
MPFDSVCKAENDDGRESRAKGQSPPFVFGRSLPSPDLHRATGMIFVCYSGGPVDYSTGAPTDPCLRALPHTAPQNFACYVVNIRCFP